MKDHLYILLISAFLLSCNGEEQPTTLLSALKETESFDGSGEYLESPYVTAGDKLYVVGHQDGSFPDLGWHVQGEMGGIWNHPIKLMDGFVLSIKESDGNDSWCLTDAAEFTNYPFANKHTFMAPSGDLEVSRLQFVPDGIKGLVVEYVIKNTSQDDKELQLSFTGMVDLTPVWLTDRLPVTDGADSVRWREESQTYVAKDSHNSWFAIFGSSHEQNSSSTGRKDCVPDRKGKGIDAAIYSPVVVKAGDTAAVRYFIAGSNKSAEKADSTYQRLKSDPLTLLEQKKRRYAEIAKLSAISIPDKEIETMYRWVKYNTDWLIRDVDTIGRGLAAGLPDYPWWFGADNCYALQGWLSTGRHKEVRATIDLIMKLSMRLNKNGRIIHETSTNGVTYNPGNLNETPHFIYLLWEAYKWTGDRSLLEKYYGEVKKGIEYIQRQDKDGNGYPDGAGMMEIHGLHSEMVDVAVYTQQAFAAAAKIAAEMKEPSLAESYQAKANTLRGKINTDWWVPGFNSFADFRSTKTQALELIDAAMVRADTLNKPWAIEELEATREKVARESGNDQKGYVVHHNWVVNTPMEMGVADQEKADEALETASRYSNRFGMYVTGMDRDESSTSSDGTTTKWKAFSYVGAVMTLPTGVQAIAEARYGRPDKALEYLKKLENSFSYALPGSMYEVSPDYGMVVQAWNIYAVAVPIVNYFFGIRPRAHAKEVIIKPEMPSQWENVSIKNVVIGSNNLSYSKATRENTVTWAISQRADWKLRLQIPAHGVTSLIINGQKQDIKAQNGMFDLVLSGVENKVEVKR